MKRAFLIGFYCAVIGATLGLAGCGPGSKPSDAPAFSVPKPTNGSSSTNATSAEGWRRISSRDGNVSVEFPLAFPAAEEVAGGMGGAPQISSYACNITNKGLSLRLSYHAIPAEAAGLAPLDLVKQIIDAMKAQGFTVVTADEITGTIPLYQIIAINEHDKQLFVIRAAVRNGNLYRAVATCVGGDYNDPIIQRFVNSFKCNQDSAPAQPSTP